MLSKFKRQKHQQNLARLPKIPILAENIQTLFRPEEYRTTLLNLIKQAKNRIYIVALYLENDDAGRDILSALYQAKQATPELDIKILVDWHRAQRGRIGVTAQSTNADWYCDMAVKHLDVTIETYGVPVNTREALGVLHLKGSIIDDTVIYSGASINDVYLHRHDKYRYDRYQLLTNAALANSLVDYINQTLIASEAVNRLDSHQRPQNPEIKPDVRRFRRLLREATYNYQADENNQQLSVSPLVGLGRNSILNKTINDLMRSTEHTLVMCTPYFNLPAHLVRNVAWLLRQGKRVEIIIGDKTANDFYIPEDQPFRIISAIPYLYEINLRRFVTRLQEFIDSGLLTVRLWKDGDNTYHLKGLWVDDEWQLITGNNLNPRAMHLDLENAVLIHDPLHEMQQQRQQELALIRQNTFVISHYQQIQSQQFYPPKIRKLIRRLRRIRIDKIISRIL